MRRYLKRLSGLLVVPLLAFSLLGGLQTFTATYAQEAADEASTLMVELYLNTCELAEFGSEKTMMDELTVRVQRIQLEVENDAEEPRGFEIRYGVDEQQFGMAMPLVEPGSRSGSMTLTLPIGEYEIRCFTEDAAETDDGPTARLIVLEGQAD